MAALKKLDARGRMLTSGAVALTALVTTAASHWRAAERDEARGFICTAALEWRKAADLLASVPALADECWCQWERLMQVPRRLAFPIGLDVSSCCSTEYSQAA